MSPQLLSEPLARLRLQGVIAIRLM